LELSVPDGLSDALSISSGNGDYYLGGAFFVSWFGPHGFALLSKEPQTLLQKSINMPHICQVMKGLPQLPALSGHVPILLLELAVFSAL